MTESKGEAIRLPPALGEPEPFPSMGDAGLMISVREIENRYLARERHKRLLRVPQSYVRRNVPWTLWEKLVGLWKGTYDPYLP